MANSNNEQNNEQLDAQVIEADIEIKKRHAELLKAQTRRTNAETKEIERRIAKQVGD